MFCSIHNSNWRQHIGVIVNKSPNCKAIQDAAHKGLGGWSSAFRFMCRITHDELRTAPIISWPIKALDHAKLDAPLHAEGLHINILEFVALIINMWFVLWATCAFGPSRRMDLVALHQQHLRPFMAAAFSLCQKSHCLPSLTFSNSNDTPGLLSRKDSQLLHPGKGAHIPGKENDKADCVSSRPVSHATCCESVMRAMLQPVELHGLLSTAVTPSHAYDTAFATQQQGGVRNGNDNTADS
jgi:hypothetical protein